MIDSIRGRVTELSDRKQYAEVVVDVAKSGISYRLLMSMREATAALHANNAGSEPLRFYTHHVFENDGKVERLYGFFFEEARGTFHNLLKVKGVGAKTALGILTAYEWNVVDDKINKGDKAALQAVPRVGAKMAQNIINDLMGKMA